MDGETRHDWLDRVVRAAGGGLADFLGLIGRHWWSVLGWMLFAMAISEPAHADSGLTLPRCPFDVYQTVVDCNSSGYSETPCAIKAISGAPAGKQRYAVVYRPPGYTTDVYWVTADCGDCASQPPDDAGNGTHWTWPGGANHGRCFDGCMWKPSPNSNCGKTCVTYQGVTTCSQQVCYPDAIGTTGEACDVGGSDPTAEEEPKTPDDIPPEPPVCKQIAENAVCVEQDAECDGYKGTFNGATICVPKGDPAPPCSGPFCDDYDPPGDANNDEANDDTPIASFEYERHDDSGPPIIDVDYFFPEATDDCDPCPAAGDPEDPRDEPEECTDPEGCDDPPEECTDPEGCDDPTDPPDDGGGSGGGTDPCVGSPDPFCNPDDPPDDPEDEPEECTDPEGCDDEPTEECTDPEGCDGPDDPPPTNPTACDIAPASHQCFCSRFPSSLSCRDGTGGGQEGGEEGGEEEQQGEALGGATCESAPSCSGDPVTCMVAIQAWQTRCAVKGFEDRVFDTEGADTSMGTEDIEPPSIDPVGEGDPIEFDASGWLGGGQCPDLNVAVLGRSYNLDEAGWLCRFLSIGAGLVLVFAAWTSARIVAGAV